MATKQSNGNGKQLNSQQALNNTIWNICDILRRSNCASALQYIPELTWLLFLRILDDREQQEAADAKIQRTPFAPSIIAPYRWQDWAAPTGAKRQALQTGPIGGLFQFVNGELLPYLKALSDQPNATSRQQLISEIISGVEKVRVDTEKNFQDVLDKVDEIRESAINIDHVFPLSQIYEGLLLKLGEKNNDGGQFFTPRPVIRAMVQVLAPKIGETVYDPSCGTGGFLAQAYQYMYGDKLTAIQLGQLKEHTFYGREKENLIYPIALANLVLHGIDRPHLWHGNTLTDTAVYAGLFDGAPTLFDVILTNPPFGGKEGRDSQDRFAFKTSATQVLFLQHIIDSLKKGGRCGVVLDEGLLFRTNEAAFIKTKRKLLDECDVWCIVSLPAGTFIGAGGGVKTNILFFTKGKPTERIWYYDLSHVKVTKKSPLTYDHFADFFGLLKSRADSERSWTVTRADIEAKGYDLKAVNPNAPREVDARTPEELLDFIEAKGREVAEALSKLRRSNGN